jgi:hypothetical protein
MATAEVETTIAVKFMLSGALGIEWSAGFDSAKPQPSPKAFVQRNEDLVAGGNICYDKYLVRKILLLEDRCYPVIVRYCVPLPIGEAD